MKSFHCFESSKKNLYLFILVLKAMIPHEFEKDEDSNGHIDYITAASVSRNIFLGEPRIF